MSKKTDGSISSGIANKMSKEDEIPTNPSDLPDVEAVESVTLFLSEESAVCRPMAGNVTLNIFKIVVESFRGWGSVALRGGLGRIV